MNPQSSASGSRWMGWLLGVLGLAVIVTVVWAMFFNTPDAASPTTTTTGDPGTTVEDPASTTTVQTTSTTVPWTAGIDWVMFGPDGLTTSSGETIVPSGPTFWRSLARDRLGGFALVDDDGVWWLSAGSQTPVLASSTPGNLVEVLIQDEEPVARLDYCESTYLSLVDGTAVTPEVGNRMEVDCDGEFSVSWRADNGLIAEIVGPEVEIDTETRTTQVLSPAVLVITHESDPEAVLLSFPVGGAYEASAGIHDFDGQRIIISRWPIEPGRPEETYFFIDLSEGLMGQWVAAASTAALTGPDVTTVPDLVVPDVNGFRATFLVTDEGVRSLEDGRYVGFLRSVYTEGPVDTPAIEFDLAVWFSGRDADYAALADGETDVPVPNDYYIRNHDSAALLQAVSGEVEVTSAWYHYPETGSLENAPITYEELATALSGEPADDTLLNMYYDPWWITIVDGMVVAIDEQYVP